MDKPFKFYKSGFWNISAPFYKIKKTHQSLQTPNRFHKVTSVTRGRSESWTLSPRAEAGHLSAPESLCSVTIMYLCALAYSLFLCCFIFSSIPPENYQLDFNSTQFS